MTFPGSAPKLLLILAVVVAGSACDDDEMPVSVNPCFPVGFSLTPQSVELAIGDSAKLSAQENTIDEPDSTVWFSRDTTVATVNQDAVVVGVGPGQTRVVVRFFFPESTPCADTEESAAAQVTVVGP